MLGWRMVNSWWTALSKLEVSNSAGTCDFLRRQIRGGTGPCGGLAMQVCREERDPESRPVRKCNKLADSLGKGEIKARAVDPRIQGANGFGDAILSAMRSDGWIK